MALDPFAGLTRVGPYHVLDAIGRGGMGAVFRARHAGLDRVVALKVLMGDVREDPTQLARFRVEARAAAALDHPGLVKLFDFGEDRGAWFLAMELISGRTLAAELDERGPFSVEETTRLTRELLSALAACHAAGLVHRDLKPQNLMLDAAGALRVLDLGLVKRIDHTALTEEGFRVGTPGYMPPEMIQDGVADPRSDLWQVGVLAYEWLAGKPAFPGDHVPRLMGDIVEKEPEPLPSGDEPGRDRLVAFIARCLVKNPAGRFASAEEALAALSPERGRVGARRPASRPPAKPYGAAAASSRGFALAGLAAGGVALGGLAAWFAVRAPAPPAATPAPPSPAVTPAVRDAAEALRTFASRAAPNLSKSIFEEIRIEASGRIIPEMTRRWRQRAESLAEPVVLGPLLADLAFALDGVEDAAVTPYERGVVLRKLADLAGFERALRDGFGADVRLGVDAVLAGPFAPLPARPAAAAPFAGLEFGDGGRAAGRAPYSGDLKLIKAPVSRFMGGSQGYLDGAFGSGSSGREYRERKFPYRDARPRRAWVGYRFAGGAPGERLVVRLQPANQGKVVDAAFLCATGGVVEGWMPVHREMAAGGTGWFRVEWENRSIRSITSGITLDWVVLAAER